MAPQRKGTRLGWRTQPMPFSSQRWRFKCQTNLIAGPFWPVPLLFPLSRFRLPVPRRHLLTASEPDPVFATVAAHREAFVEHMRAARLDGKLMRSDPRAEATGAALDAADEVYQEATLELSEVVPTTMAGVVALLRYLEEFQEQAIELPEAPRQWHSGDHDALLTETYEHPNLVDKFNGEPLELPFVYWVMQNVRTALQSLVAVQS